MTFKSYKKNTRGNKETVEAALELETLIIIDRTITKQRSFIFFYPLNYPKQLEIDI